MSGRQGQVLAMARRYRSLNPEKEVVPFPLGITRGPGIGGVRFDGEMGRGERGWGVHLGEHARDFREGAPGRGGGAGHGRGRVVEARRYHLCTDTVQCQPSPPVCTHHRASALGVCTDTIQWLCISGLVLGGVEEEGGGERASEKRERERERDRKTGWRPRTKKHL